MEKKAYLEIAKIINTHGVRGAVKLDPWCDSPAPLKKIKRLENKIATLFEKADRYSRVYGLEHPKTIRAWIKYDKCAAKLGI